MLILMMLGSSFRWLLYKKVMIFGHMDHSYFFYFCVFIFILNFILRFFINLSWMFIDNINVCCNLLHQDLYKKIPCYTVKNTFSVYTKQIRNSTFYTLAGPLIEERRARWTQLGVIGVFLCSIISMAGLWSLWQVHLEHVIQAKKLRFILEVEEYISNNFPKK